MTIFTAGRTNSTLRSVNSPRLKRVPRSTAPQKRSTDRRESLHAGSSARSSALKESKARERTERESTQSLSMGKAGSKASSIRATDTSASSTLAATRSTTGVIRSGRRSFTVHISTALRASTSAINTMTETNRILERIRRISFYFLGGAAVIWKQACRRSCFTTQRPSARSANTTSASRFLRSSNVR